jgi:hypothetical protein
MSNDKKDDGNDEQQNDVLKIALIVTGAAWTAFLIIAAVVWIAGDGDKKGLERLAQFGDAFGVINALFSSAAVAGAIYAVILQQRELVLTRQEMRQAREAHEDSADSQERMAAIQGYTTIVSDLAGEITAMQHQLHEIRELRGAIDSIFEDNKEQIESDRVTARLFRKLKDKLDVARTIGLIPAAKGVVTTGQQASENFLSLRNLVHDSQEILAEHVASLLKQKAEAMKALQEKITGGKA